MEAIVARNFAVGYALIDRDGVLFFDAAATTERAAMVNALVAIYGHPVFATDSDGKIRADFHRLKHSAVEVGPVNVEKLVVVSDDT